MTKGRVTKRLTFYELEVLKLLRERSDETVSRDELLEKVWGNSSEIETRTIDNFIVRFRKYFEKDSKNPMHFVTKRGVGYSFNA